MLDRAMDQHEAAPPELKLVRPADGPPGPATGTEPPEQTTAWTVSDLMRIHAAPREDDSDET
jgi:hypothetical protein